MDMTSLDPSISIGGRVLGMLVFGVGVLGKLRHRQEFMGVVANYRIISEPLVPAAAWVIIALEIVVALCLASGVFLRSAAALALGLLGVFAVAISVNLARGRKHIDCGCFQSSLRQQLSAMLVVRNVLLALVILPLLASPMPGVSILQWLDGVAVGAVLFLLYGTFSRIWALPESTDPLRGGGRA